MGAMKQKWCSPTEFWRLTPQDLFWLYEAYLPEKPVQKGPSNKQLAKRLKRILEDEARVSDS